MKNRIGRALDRRLSGVECTGDMQLDILRRIARGEGKDNMKMRRKMPAALVAALVGALLLAGLAYAVSQSGLLNWMYRDRQPNESAVQLIKSEDRTVEEGGVRFSLKESLFDARHLMLIYSIENTTGETLLLDTERLEGTVTVNGERVQSNNEGNSLQAVGGQIGGIQMPNPYEQIIVYELPPYAEGQSVQVDVTAYVYKPLTALAADDEQFMGLDEAPVPPERGLIFSTKGRALLGYYDAIQKAHAQNNQSVWGESSDMDADYWDGDALVDAKYAEPLHALTLSFTLSPERDKQSRGTTVKGRNTFKLNDFTLVVKDMDFRAAGGHILIEIWPEQQPIPVGSGAEDVRMYDHPLYRWSEFFDENGEKLLPGGDEGPGFAGSGGFRTDEHGRTYFLFDWKTDPLSQIPSKVTIVPMDNYKQALERNPGLTEDAYSEDPSPFYDWDNAVTVELEPKE